MVLFDEFCNWAIAKEMKIGLDEDDAVELKTQSLFRIQKSSSAQLAYTAPTSIELKQSVSPEVWQELADKLPWKKTKEHHRRRLELFRDFDPNGNGHLSLAEIDRGVKLILQCETLFNVKPVLMRAYAAAKSKESASNADYVELGEFRTLLWYLRRYFEYWVMFDDMDTSDDRRIEFGEFERSLSKLAQWGVVVADAQKAFREMDADGVRCARVLSGYVLCFVVFVVALVCGWWCQSTAVVLRVRPRVDVSVGFVVVVFCRRWHGAV